jgi:hypothetical protein
MDWIIYSVVIVLLAVGGWYAWEVWSSHRPDRTVYVASDIHRHLPALEQVIQRYLEDPSKTPTEYTWVEAGAGLAAVTTRLRSRFPWKDAIAVEVSPTIYLAGRLRTLWQRPAIRWVRTDVLSYTFPQPAVIYCYLFSALTTRLYRQGAFKENLVFCLTFPIEGVGPTEVLPVEGWQQRLYVYDFRSPATGSADGNAKREGPSSGNRQPEIRKDGSAEKNGTAAQ